MAGCGCATSECGVERQVSGQPILVWVHKGNGLQKPVSWKDESYVRKSDLWELRGL
jgi:hypothetical protein